MKTPLNLFFSSITHSAPWNFILQHFKSDKNLFFLWTWLSLISLRNWETTTLRDDYLQVLPWCGPSFKAGNLSCTLHPLMALSKDLNDRLKHLQFVFAFESLWDNKLLRSSVCLSTDISVCWIPVVGHLIMMNSKRELKLLNLIVRTNKRRDSELCGPYMISSMFIYILV